MAHLSRGRALDVYEVWSEERACRCIAKVVRPDRLDDRSARRRLRSEGRLLLGFAHPHIVRAYELIERPDPVLILETLTGATLTYIIDARPRRLSAAELAFLGAQLCSAVQYLHRHDVLHLDLKPCNVVSELGLAKVIDLSLAQAPGRGRKGAGTRPYMAPEQARGGLLTAATDVWGIGAVLFEAATGLQPFQDRPRGVEYPQLERRADSVRRHRRLARATADAIDSCLEPDPEGRPAVEELRRSFESVHA